MEAELPESGRRGSVRVWISVLLAASCLAVYGRLGGYPFIAMDDMEYVAGNPHVREGATLQGVAWAATAFRAANWHPLTWLSHMLDVELFGMSAGAHHLVNVAFHGANGVLLFLLLSRLTGFMGRSAIVAGLFLLHPLHVESVAWISERKDVLSGLFFLLTLWAYSGYVERRTRGRYFAVILWFALGLLSKPMVVTLPFALLLLDRWPLDRTEPWRSLASEKVPLFLMSAASCAVTYAAQAGAGSLAGLDRLSLPIRIANAVVAYAAYLGKAVWPSSLAMFYPHPGNGLPPWRIAGSFLLLSVLSLLAARQRDRRPYLLWGWLWYLGMLVPVIGLVQVGGQGMADRYTYLPLIGPFVAAVWGVAEAAGEGRRRAQWLASAAGVALFGLACAASVQVDYWRDQEAVVDRALAVTSGNWLAENSKGVLLQERGRTDEAIVHFRAALAANPRFPPALENLQEALQARSGAMPAEPTSPGDYGEAPASTPGTEHR